MLNKYIEPKELDNEIFCNTWLDHVTYFGILKIIN